jgi:hypothetical protein
LVGDRAYDSDPLDQALRQDGIEMIAPHRSNRSKPPTQDRRRLSRYMRRWLVERFFARDTRATCRVAPKSRQLDLGELTRRLEAELRGSPPLRRQSPPLRTEAAQSEASVQVEPDGEEAVPNDSAEKNPAR